MLLVTTPTVPNKAITETLGIARGSTVRARNVGQDIFAGLKNIIGGEINEYTKLQSRNLENKPPAYAKKTQKNGRQCHYKCPFNDFDGDARLF